MWCIIEGFVLESHVARAPRAMNLPLLALNPHCAAAPDDTAVDVLAWSTLLSYGTPLCPSNLQLEL